MLRARFITANAYFRKEERSQINDPNIYSKKLKKAQIKSKARRRKEIIKNIAEINELE